MSSKFAKKGSLVVDVKGAKLHKVGDENPKTKKFLKDAGIEEAPEAKAKPAKAAKLVKAEKPAKAEKATKAPKAAKEPKEAKEGGVRASNDDRKITVHTKVNPHREGSGRYEAYEALKSSKRVSDYAASGNKTKYLAKWEEQGFISIA